MILLDTHVWFWAITGSSRLSTRHRELIERQPTDCSLCAVTVWEFGMLVNRGKVRVNAPLREWLNRALDAWPVPILAIEHDVALRATEINLATGDPVDHLIYLCRRPSARAKTNTLSPEYAPFPNRPRLQTTSIIYR